MLSDRQFARIEKIVIVVAVPIIVGLMGICAAALFDWWRAWLL